MQTLFAYAVVVLAAVWLLRRYIPWRRLRSPPRRTGSDGGCGPDCGCSP